jgi:DNA-3-methyladenine glycosylase II
LKKMMMSSPEEYLSKIDPDWAALIQRVGPSRLAVTRRSPYEALVRAVAHQQLHGKAAEAILRRLTGLFPDHLFPPPELLLERQEQELRGCGLSAAKLAAIRDIAGKTLDGLVPCAEDAAAMENEELIERLVALRGVGRWTVEMLLIFTLGRPDILPVDDFGVREGYRKLKSLEAQPKPKALAEIGKAWSPYRSTAAWYLWRAAELN